MADRDLHWIADGAGLRRLAAALRAADTIAVDTEQDAFFSYRPKICLIQFATADADWVLDPLAERDLSILAEPLADPHRATILHAGDNDISLLARDFDLEVRGLFDTMSAAAILGYKRTGLAALIEQHFGIAIEKKFQRSDWRRRPLERGQIEYAALDVRYLASLKTILENELAEKGRVEEALSDFQRIENVRHEQRTVDPDDYYRIDGVRDLNGVERRILRDLFVLRDRASREEDRAAFRVCPDSALMELVRLAPTSTAKLRGVRGLSDRFLERHAQDVIEIVRAAVDAGELAPPRPPIRDHAPLDDAERALFDHLRAWRKKRAEARGVEVGRVVPNALLTQVVRAQATTEDELAAAGFEPWRIREYGGEVLAVMRRGKKPR
jgi:ribonuclease D